MTKIDTLSERTNAKVQAALDAIKAERAVHEARLNSLDVWRRQLENVAAYRSVTKRMNKALKETRAAAEKISGKKRGRPSFDTMLSRFPEDERDEWTKFAETNGKPAAISAMAGALKLKAAEKDAA